MNRKLYPPTVLLLAFSMIVSACGSPALSEEATPIKEAPVIETHVVTEAPITLNYLPLLVDFWASVPANTGYGLLSAATLSEEIAAGNAPFLLDVREAAEVGRDGYIEGAVNVPIRVLLQNLDKLPAPDRAIVIYSSSGHQSGFALMALKMLGYSNVRNLGGGPAAWKKADLPILTGAMPEPPVGISELLIEDKTLLAALDGFLTRLPEDSFSVGSDALAIDLMGKTTLLLDVRSQLERDRDGYIESDALIPFPDFLKRLNQLPADKDTRIVVYCISGHRGSMVTMALRLLGYTNVANLDGGLNGWQADGMNVAGWVDWAAVLGDFVQNLPADQGYYSVTADDFNTAHTEVPNFLVDVRELSEVESSGHIKGAINIPIRDLLKNLDKLPGKDQKIVIYCGSNHRSAMGMTALRTLGYTDVFSLADGIEGWEKAGFALEPGLPSIARVVTPAPEVDTTRLKLLDAYLTALPDGFDIVEITDLNAEIASEDAPFVLDVCIEDGTTALIRTVLVSFNTAPQNQLRVPDDKETPIVVVCEYGHRSAIFKMYLNFLGYINVRTLAK